ncbi:hypothetical protein ABPG73_018712 [Tetrahymena malaccensis]
MNQQIIFASLNQMYILPVRIDIRTNEFKQKETFGLVAKVKQINEEYQYIVFNQTDLSVIGLTQKIHKMFFPNCDNLQKVNLKNIFPFLISTQNDIKPLENGEIANNSVISKNRIHVNLQENMEEFLKDQIKSNNKLTFIVIQNQETTNFKLNSSLMASKSKQSMKKLNKMKSTKEAQSFCFTYVELVLKRLNYNGVNNVSYIEITKTRQLNPLIQAPIILQEITNIKKQNIYSQLFSYPEELQNLITELEQKTINFYQINSYDSQLNFTSRDLNQQQQLKEINSFDEQNHNIKIQQQFQKSQTIGDESTNLEQVQIKASNLDNKNVNSQDLECYSYRFNQQFTDLKQQIRDNLHTNPEKNQNNFNQKVQLKVQNSNNQNQKFNYSLKEIQQIDCEEGEDNLNRVNFAFKDINIHNIQEDQQNFNNNITLISPCKSDKTLNIELISPMYSSQRHIFPIQQSLNNFSNQELKSPDLKSYQTKETLQQDLEFMKNQSRQILSQPNNYFYEIKEKISTNKSVNRNKYSNPERQVVALSQNEQNKQNNQLDSDKQISLHLKDKSHKKKQIQNLQYDIASASSKDSSSATAKRQLEQIMADKSVLQVIKVIKIFGIVCFAVMIFITWLQFSSMENNLSNANKDFKVFNWPTSYSSSLSDILKYKNTLYLIQYSKQLPFSSQEQKQIFQTRTQSELQLSLTEVYGLLSQMSRESTDRKVFQQIRQTNTFYFLGQMYNTTLLNTTLSDSIGVFGYNHSTSLLSSILLGIQLTFRYTHNLGNGRPEFYLIQNQLVAISELEKVQNSILIEQQKDEQYIQDQLTVVIIVLVIISAACVATIIPFYFYIQKQRDDIIYLFSTFPIIKLDNLIKKIQNSCINQSVYSVYQNQNGHSLFDQIISVNVLDNDKNIRKQNISSITKLPRFNKYLILVSFSVYLLIICYPIIVKLLTQDYLNKSTVDLQTMMKVYNLRSYLLQNIAMHFNILTMKVNPKLKPMQPDIYYGYLKTLIKQQEDIYNDIQWITKSQYKDQRYNQEEYDDFFFNSFKSNLCDSFRSYPQYSSNSTKINVDICNQSQQGFLSQGLQIAYKSLLNQFIDLYNLYIIKDQSLQQSQISSFLSKFDIKDYTAFTEFIDETIISLNNFILTQANNHYLQIKIWLFALIAFQMVLMVLIFSFGWISFSNYLNGQLHKTKNYLTILDVNTLIENPYILTYIKKNTIV